MPVIWHLTPRLVLLHGVGLEKLVVEQMAALHHHQAAIFRSVLDEVDDTLRALEPADPRVLVLVWPASRLGARCRGREWQGDVYAVEGDQQVGVVPDFGEGGYDARFEAGAPDE